MTLSEITRLFSPARWAVIGVIFVLALFATWYVLTEPGRQRQRAAEARAAGAFSAASASSAQDATRTVISGAARETQIDQQSQEAEDEIRNAQDGDRNAIALARLCMRDAYARDPVCVGLRRAGPD